MIISAVKPIILGLTLWLGCLSMTIAASSRETVLHAPGPKGSLEGTYTDAGKRADMPVILIIPGSGPTDRDGNNPLGVTAATYRYLAQGLADAGISSVRIDKRGQFGSRAAIADPNDVTLGEYADDVAAWIETIKAQTAVDCVWLLGHSEGALVALESVAQSRSSVCGIILAAASSQPFGDLLRQQLKDNPANATLIDDAFAAIDALEAGKRVDVTALHPALQQLFAPDVQGFLIDLMGKDPAAMIAAVDLPVLILQGERDLQVPAADAVALKAAQPNATLALLPDTNHVLKTVTGNSPADNMATYADPDLPLAPGVVPAIVDFVDDAPPGR